MIFSLPFPPTAGTCPYPHFLPHLYISNSAQSKSSCAAQNNLEEIVNCSKLWSSLEGHQPCSHCNGINKQLINCPFCFTSALSWWILSTVPCRALSCFAAMESSVAASLSEVSTALCSSFSSLSRLSTCTCALASSLFFWKQENRLVQCAFFYNALSFILPPTSFHII